jgi:hypothetical protein
MTLLEQEDQAKQEELYLLKKPKKEDLHPQNKICITCGTNSVKNHAKDWHKGPTCKSCYKKQKYHSNPELDKIRRKNNYLKNIDREKEWRKTHYLENKEIYYEKHKQYYIDNAERILFKNKEYRLLNKAKINDHFLNRRKTDINFKLAGNLRSRLRKALICKYKTGSAVSDLGCSIEDFKKHLESQFELGMTWDNYGPYNKNIKRWNIDHVIPLSSVDLTNKDQLKIVCHYNNLRPLWAEKNLKDGARK